MKKSYSKTPLNKLRVALTGLIAFLKTDFGIALALAVGWQLAMALVGVLIERSFSPDPKELTSLLSHTSYWDSGWYNNILSHWYTNSDASPVFYPLFPLAVSTIQHLSFNILSSLAAGFILNTVSLWLALAALIKISRHFIGDNTYRWLPIGLFLLSPVSFFLHLFYTEALFCAIVYWAYWFAVKRRWAPMSILLALATASRLPSLLFICLCGLEYLNAYGWSLKKAVNKNLLWFLISPLGFIFYGFYLYIVRGDFFAMLHAYSITNDWAYHIFNPNIFKTIFEAAEKSTLVLLGFEPFRSWVVVQYILPTASLLLLVVTSIYALMQRRKEMFPMAFFGLLSVVLFTLNSNVVSVHRYALPCFSIYIILGWAAKRHPSIRPLIIIAISVSILLQLVLYSFFIMHRFAG